MLRRRRARVTGQPRGLGWLDLARRTTGTDVTAAYRRIDPTAGSDQVDRLAAAVGQWCRLVGGYPAARLAVPSAAVAEVWSALGGDATDPDDGGAIGVTYLLACTDEAAVPPHLPLLFRVDWALDRLDGRTYEPNCGEVRYCAAQDGTVCLQHVANPPRRKLVWRGPPAGIALAQVGEGLRPAKRP